VFREAALIETIRVWLGIAKETAVSDRLFATKEIYDKKQQASFYDKDIN
jgi:hypothetical protein